MKTSFSPLKFDEVGYWSELKLEIVEKYGSAYTNAFSQRGRGLKKYYIDGFSGAGAHIAKRTGKQIEGSPARALSIKPPFDGFYFIDIDPEKTRYLERLCEGRNDVTIYTGESNAYLIDTCFQPSGTKTTTVPYASLTPMVSTSIGASCLRPGSPARSIFSSISPSWT
jgi:three-Cys-motif partner protein